MRDNDLADHKFTEPTPHDRNGGSHVRHRVLAFTVALAWITYLDRVCIASTAQDLMRELNLSIPQMGFVFSAFTIAYALFEIPTGAWGDRIGPRRLLTRIVIWWSSFTIATAAAFNFTSLLAVRFLFGAGEAGAFPNVSKSFSRWFPVTERGTAQGIFFAGAHLGGGVTPPLMWVLLQFLPWRMVFVVFGAIGFVWAAAWFLWFRDDPAEHSEVGVEELAMIQSGRKPDVPHRLDIATLRLIITDRNVILLSLMYFTQAYGFYFNITWLPTYLSQARRVFFDSTGRFGGIAADDQRCGRHCWRSEHGSGRACVWAQGRPVRDRSPFAAGRGYGFDRRRDGAGPFAFGAS